MSESTRASVVPGVLAQMDRHTKRIRLAALSAAVIESLVLLLALLRIDWRNDTHVLVFVLSVLSYTIVALGILALGAHVSRVGARIVAALDGGNAG